MKLEVNDTNEIEEIENYKKKTIEEDRKIAQKTYSDKEKREVSAKQNGTNKRLEIGYKIPEEPSFMEEIMEEERSEEHTSELQSRGHLVCRLLLEKKKRITRSTGG